MGISNCWALLDVPGLIDRQYVHTVHKDGAKTATAVWGR